MDYAATYMCMHYTYAYQHTVANTSMIMVITDHALSTYNKNLILHIRK